MFPPVNTSGRCFPEKEDSMLSVGKLAQFACIWEATARKPGNVHRFRDFADTGYVDFLLSAAIASGVLETAASGGVGRTVFEGVRQTREIVSCNTNLGILLLLAPLAAVPAAVELSTGLDKLLENLSVEDARWVYRAIRLAAPGGLGRVPEQDVSTEPTLPLPQVMALAAGRDRIARQYGNGFRDVFDGASTIAAGLETVGSLEDAIILCHLRLMASHPDSLIVRKRGPAEGEESRVRAENVLASGWPHRREGREALAELDDWLREDGNARNPGTSADLVAASLFAALRLRKIKLPLAYPWAVRPPG